MSRFVTLEGGEGSGKSTQIKFLSARLKQAGIDHILTREPGGAPQADAVRALLVTGEPGRWDGMSEALLHYAARREHLRHTVRPALAAGQWVLCDRFADSSMAYQGYGHRLGREPIEILDRLVLGGVKPDLTLIIDLPIEVGLARAEARAGNENRYERMGLDFHRRLREGFLDIARREPDRCIVVDGRGSVEAVGHDLWQALARRFGLAR